MTKNLVGLKEIHVFMHPFFAHGKFEEVESICREGREYRRGKKLEQLVRRGGEQGNAAELEYERLLDGVVRRIQSADESIAVHIRSDALLHDPDKDLETLAPAVQQMKSILGPERFAQTPAFKRLKDSEFAASAGAALGRRFFTLHYAGKPVKELSNQVAQGGFKITPKTKLVVHGCWDGLCVPQAQVILSKEFPLSQDSYSTGVTLKSKQVELMRGRSRKI